MLWYSWDLLADGAIFFPLFMGYRVFSLCLRLSLPGQIMVLRVAHSGGAWNSFHFSNEVHVHYYLAWGSERRWIYRFLYRVNHLSPCNFLLFNHLFVFLGFQLGSVLMLDGPFFYGLLEID